MFENVKKYIELNKKGNSELIELLLDNRETDIIIKILSKREEKKYENVKQYLRFTDEKFRNYFF